MRAASLLVGLLAALFAQQSPPLTPASVILAIDANHVDEKLLAAALAHPDVNVRAAGARVVGVFSVAPLADAVATALEKETDPRAGAELARALLFLRGSSAGDPAQAAAQRLGSGVADAVKAWHERVAKPYVPATANDLMFSRAVDVWLPGLLSDLAAAAQCALRDEPHFGAVRITYSGDGRPRRVEIDKGNLSKPCASVLAAIGRTTLAEDDQPVGDGLQQWVVVPFSRAFATCTQEIDVDRKTATTPSPGSAPRKIKDVRPQYPREMQGKRMSGFVVVEGWVSTRGCLTNLRIVKSPAIPFELEALRAMSGWEFEPARQHGRVVPIRTTMTTTFNIR